MLNHTHPVSRVLLSNLIEGKEFYMTTWLISANANMYNHSAAFATS